jgi:hypothetical protein
MKTKITFELESETSVSIKQNGIQVGRLWSEHKDGTMPYPHDESDRTKNSIQLCGFDRQSEIWACGPFEGKKDTCFSFLEIKDKNVSLSHYEDYVKNCIRTGNTALIKNFNDWLLHHY